MYKKLGLGSPVEYGSYAIKKRLGKIAKYIDFRGKNVLDIGCGNGSYTTEMAKQAELTVGIDVELVRLIAFTKARQGLNPNNNSCYNLRAAGEKIPFKNNLFDVITMIEVFEHVYDEHIVLKECKRVLKQGGYLVLFVPNKLYPFDTHGANIGGLKLGGRFPFISWVPTLIHSKIAHARIYTTKKIKKTIQKSGFYIEAVDYIYPPLDRINLPVGFKAFYRNIAERLENTFLKAFGVSILIVGKKK